MPHEVWILRWSGGKRKRMDTTYNVGAVAANGHSGHESDHSAAVLTPPLVQSDPSELWAKNYLCLRQLSSVH